MGVLLNVCYVVGLILYSPKIIYRMIWEKRYRAGWGQRIGRLERRFPQKPCIWLHAVSVGEVNAARTLIKALGERLPGYEIVLSSTTDTGLARAAAVYGNELAVFYFPFDLSWTMKCAFDRLKPNLILLMELEVWPNLASIAQRRDIPVVVVNGRLSDNSFPRYKKVRCITAWMFRKVSLVLAQTSEYAKRFVELGCPAERVRVTSSLKYDTAQTAGRAPGADRLAEQINLGADPLWVAGGTGPGEEQIAIDVYKRLRQQAGLFNLRLAIIPRKPERFDDAAALIEQTGFQYIRYGRLKADDTCAQGRPEIILGDTMGDLKKFYALASVVFVGRSLVPMGGSDMMEPAAMGRCTTFGPHTFNFKQTVDALLEGVGAIEAADAGQLYDITFKCLSNPEFADAVACAGQKVIRQNQGATRKTVDAVVELLGV